MNSNLSNENKHLPFKEKGQRPVVLTGILFTIYLASVLWIILLKLQFSITELDSIRSINLIPFYGSVLVNGRIRLSEITMNVIIFIPFGIYIGVLAPMWPFYKKCLTFTSFSLILEIMQYILAIGRTDITDLITNSLGGIAGILIYMVFCKFCRSETRSIHVINLLAVIGTIVMFSFLMLLLLLN